jgi:hypothetical protein
MILFILKISESEQFDDAQLKGKNNRSFKRRGIGYDKMLDGYLERILR